MKHIITLYLFSIVSCLPSLLCQGQEFKNDAGEKEKHFIYQVKQIDEFFERFNDAPNSFSREIYKSYKIKYNLDRKKLIKSLFNYEGKTWSQQVIDSFVRKALLTKMPSSLNWHGENWYAEANCKFQYNSTIISIPVILRIMTDEKKRSKWVITGIKNNLLKEPQNNGIPITVRTLKTKFINPSNHGTNFIELSKVFEDKDHLSDYFDNEFFYRANAVQFYQSIMKTHISFLFVQDVKYHFLNVPGYIFTVDYFQRETLNSGWLINYLISATANEKDIYKKQLLGE